MASNTVHTITLSGYTATLPPGAGWALQLGTWDSYGIEQIQLTLGSEWAGLVITAKFTPPGRRHACQSGGRFLPACLMCRRRPLRSPDRARLPSPETRPASSGSASTCRMWWPSTRRLTVSRLIPRRASGHSLLLKCSRPETTPKRRHKPRKTVRRRPQAAPAQPLKAPIKPLRARRKRRTL